MLFQNSGFKIYILCRSLTLLKNNMNNSVTAIALENRICNIERTITTLQTEVKDIRKLLKNLSDSNIINPTKKRKFCQEGIDVSDKSSLVTSDSFITDSDGYTHVYTDGACEKNGSKNAKAGLGVWFGPNHPLNLAEPVKRRPTNNVGEIEACTRAIQVAHNAGIKKLCINTDSEFTINCITKWIHGWKKKNWITASGKPVINKDELIELDETIQLLEGVKWNHVRGHRGIKGNEAADELARQGALMYQKSI